MIRAIAGAVGFGTRLPVGRSGAAWDALLDRPGLLALAAVPTAVAGAGAVALPVPAETAAIAYVGALVAVGGITHLDGLADCGDAAVAHGSPAERRAIVADTRLGVGGTFALALWVVALVAAGLVLGRATASEAVGIVVASEATASLAMVALAVAGPATTDGLGGTVIEAAGPTDALVAAAIALPLLAAGGSAGPGVPIATLLGGAIAALAVAVWARRALGGVTGDVLGATHAIARVLAVHAGVVVWTAS
ncbi:MAG: adenosylcobinamide-GDP ribazoletransferase [Halococcoides sp.]